MPKTDNRNRLRVDVGGNYPKLQALAEARNKRDGVTFWTVPVVAAHLIDEHVDAAIAASKRNANKFRP